MDDVKTDAITVSLTGGGKLVMYTQDLGAVKAVAENTDALFRWLGVPRGFTLNLWWRDDPRILAADEWPNRRNVNGGWTTLDSDTIYVYRQEEWDRVLLHESIHALGWDWPMPSKPLPCWGFGPDDTLMPALFEAWTELYAEWLWCGYHNVPWDTQRDWQDTQAVQILSRAGGSTSWKENTNVFAYYVLKAALAPHIGFLWTFRNGATPEERAHVLCTLVAGPLAALNEKASKTTPKRISLRMTTHSK